MPSRMAWLGLVTVIDVSTAATIVIAVDGDVVPCHAAVSVAVPAPVASNSPSVVEDMVPAPVPAVNVHVATLVSSVWLPSE